MRDTIDWPHARQRGREMKALAWVEHVGTPIDAQLYEATRTNWARIRGSVIQQFDADYGVFVDGKFSFKLFEDYLARAGIEDWPTTASGRLKSDDDTFKEASEAYPQLTTLRRLRRTLGEMRSSQLSVGSDGRNRTLSALRGAHGEKHTISQQVRVRAECLDARLHPSRPRARVWLSGLRAARVGSRGSLLPR